MIARLTARGAILARLVTSSSALPMAVLFLLFKTSTPMIQEPAHTHLTHNRAGQIHLSAAIRITCQMELLPTLFTWIARLPIKLSDPPLPWQAAGTSHGGHSILNTVKFGVILTRNVQKVNTAPER